MEIMVHSKNSLF